MDLESILAGDLLLEHPVAAAQAFEQLPARDVAGLLAEIEIEVGAGALRHMATHSAAAVVAELEPGRAVELCTRMTVESAALILRRLEPSLRDRLLAELPGRRARDLASVLGFPEGTAGSLMDPEVLALPHDLSAREAVERVREAAGNARYNLYVVDREQRLVGVINLRELLMARAEEPIASLMKTAVHKLAARADRHAVVTNPGWRVVHSLPVVDTDGCYVGAVRYRTLRTLEQGVAEGSVDDAITARALGGLFHAGASAVLEAIVESNPPNRLSPNPGRSRDGA
jgi:magnesium transporter